jgi:fused signal recognition particle receptor
VADVPVAEEPVALVEDEQAPHVTPPIPVHASMQEPVRAPVIEPVVAAPVVKAPEPAPAVVPVEASPYRRNQGVLRPPQARPVEDQRQHRRRHGQPVPGKAIDDELLDDIETRLLTADVGVEATS